ncbi:unnamed protein product [Hermetia illucens]|uniref:Uncharacterized protein n=1 Tax=Hermetia illucens TaxID=343691 RepID=A0A7R8YST5_HERIL|nr:unnamed protein product [Hermetia illucens]
MEHLGDQPSIEKLQALITMFRANHRKLLGLLKPDDPYFGVQEEMVAKFGAIKALIESDQAQIGSRLMTEKEDGGQTGIPSDTSGATHDGLHVDNFTIAGLTSIPAAGTYTEERQTCGVSEHLPKLVSIQIPFFCGIIKERKERKH